MSDTTIQQFEDRGIRSVWNPDEQQWYFSVVDVVAVLTDSSNPRDYFKKMRKRDRLLDAYVGTNCPHVGMRTESGKVRSTLAANPEQVFRIVQSIPSKKAEPFKLWLAKVGAERIEEIVDPELAIDRAFDTYYKKGYSAEWIHQRLLSIRIRNDLTAEWRERGMEDGRDFAILTDDITKAWAGMTTRRYKSFKGLTKENLRDNMTDTELVLNMLAETSVTSISRAEKPEGFSANREVAKRGGRVAATARQALETETGEPVITSLNASDFANLLIDTLLEVPMQIGSEGSGEAIDDD
ncbi:BRO family protein [uncultured Adlercreutzia sp.]|uniref:BRO family protein n=1 Tax=uncultured Adlercreutzia sp. TaxID=875803 RepID=UPI0025FA08BB|nr:BRO family protein [uncultured Adlercreutzia sp.]